MKQTETTSTIGQAIQNIREAFGEPPYVINNGRCGEFAREVSQRVDDAKVCSYPDYECPGSIGHEWIMHRGQFYDAECPEGVEDWRDLPIFRRGRQKELTGEWVDDLAIVDRRLAQAEKLRELGRSVRTTLQNEHGTVAGHCVEASERLLEQLEDTTLDGSVVEGWCLYDRFEGCTDRPYDEHTWLQVELYEGTGVYVDATFDQFSDRVACDVEAVMVGQRPASLQTQQPDDQDLRRIGWLE